MRRLESPTIPPDLADCLSAAGFDESYLREKLGISHPDDVGLLNRAAALERLADDTSPAAALARIFYLESAEPWSTLRRAVPRADLLVRTRLLAKRGARVHARLRIDAIDGFYVAADRRFESPDLGALGLARGDMVYPVGSDSAILARLVAVPEGARVLDLCTGSGVQALAAARRASAVTAVDVGRRAVAMVRINATLNGVRNVEALRGDLYAPVAGRRFGAIIANPPFVPAPARGPAYHSGGPLGDRILSRVLQGAEEHLEDGGRLFAVSHLAMREGENVADRVRPWLGSFRGRAAVFLLESGSAVDLAAAQALFALDSGFESYAREVRRWVSYLRRHDVAVVLFIAVALEKGEGNGLDVVEAFQRTLPLPLSKAPQVMVEEWLQSTRSGGGRV